MKETPRLKKIFMLHFPILVLTYIWLAYETGWHVAVAVWLIGYCNNRMTGTHVSAIVLALPPEVAREYRRLRYGEEGS